eukprot:8093683-Pyramimonas_sp.AAC.1
MILREQERIDEAQLTLEIMGRETAEMEYDNSFLRSRSWAARRRKWSTTSKYKWSINVLLCQVSRRSFLLPEEGGCFAESVWRRGVEEGCFADSVWRRGVKEGCFADSVLRRGVAALQ